MKKRLYSVLTLILLLSLFSACGSTPAPAPEATQAAAATVAPVVDIDLTLLSGPLAYAQVYNMLVEPNKFMGKNIRLSGPYATSYDQNTKTTYHFVLVTDETSCCQQGMEFISPEGKYPEEGALIDITGVFSTYMEEGNPYFYLAASNVTTK